MKSIDALDFFYWKLVLNQKSILNRIVAFPELWGGQVKVTVLETDDENVFLRKEPEAMLQRCSWKIEMQESSYETEMNLSFGKKN